MNAATPTTNPARKRLLLTATGVFILIAIAYGIWWALFGAHFESTDDAYVHGNLVQITPQVPGTVVAIEADDTETVTAGQPLVRIDPADTQVALQQAEAKLAQTVRQVRTYYVQNDALAAGLQVTSVNVQSAHGFRLQVGAVVLEVEGGDGAQSGFFAHAAVDGARISTVTGIRIDRARTFARIVAAFGRTTDSNSHGQSQSGELTEFQHFHV